MIEQRNFIFELIRHDILNPIIIKNDYPRLDSKQLLLDRTEEYAWAEGVGLQLLDGTDPTTILPNAKTIIVLMELYFRKSYPRSMEGNFGRDRSTARLTLGVGLAVSAFPLSVPV